jgi:diguanylate cyclase (GGDEF)-like protein
MAPNAPLAHRPGAAFRRGVATRLLGGVRSDDVDARLGGDEFAVLQTGVRDVEAARLLAEKMQHAINLPYGADDHLLRTSATIGIAVYPDHGDNPDHLMQRADLALYQAKDWGRNTISFYSELLDRRLQQRDSLISELSRAERNGEFELHYQPIADAGSGRIEAVEALLRWRHPERGLLTAEVFIHAVEASREAQRISLWVLVEACRQARSWQQQGLPSLRLAINLSMPLLQRPDLVEVVRRAVLDCDLDPARLELELTERMIITAGASGVVPKLLALQKLGIHIALDDFGTGFSSLSLLKDLPVDRIKIDRSFVAGFGTNPNDTAIVRAVTRLGRSMNKRVTAEGVEQAQTLDLLRAEGCHEIQGYHLARPMPADRIAAFLHREAEKTTI